MINPFKKILSKLSAVDRKWSELTPKNTPVREDTLSILDSEASNENKITSISNVVNTGVGKTVVFDTGLALLNGITFIAPKSGPFLMMASGSASSTIVGTRGFTLQIFETANPSNLLISKLQTLFFNNINIHHTLPGYFQNSFIDMIKGTQYTAKLFPSGTAITDGADFWNVVIF